MAMDARDWAHSLYAALDGDRMVAGELRQAGVVGDLTRWTRVLTDLVAQSPRGLGLEVAAKGPRCTAQPMAQEEYLVVDVTALPDAGSAWLVPGSRLGGGELASRRSGRVRGLEAAVHPTRAARLPERARRCNEACRVSADSVVGAMTLSGRERLSADTLVFVGSRSEADTLSYGFLQAWCLNRNVGRFETFRWQD